MAVTRREFVQLSGAGVAAELLVGAAGRRAVVSGMPGPLKAVAFDAFPIFSPARVTARAEALFPGRATALAEEWRLRQFEYAWLRALSGRYADFWQVTRDALIFAATKLKLDLGATTRDELMGAFLELDPWPDVVPALGALAQSGLRLAFLSNLAQRMLDANLERSGLAGRFEQVLSTDRARTYKPDPRAYALGAEALGLQRDEVLFVAHAGWDAAGAKAFGYPTFWVNRGGLPPEELGAAADAAGHDLSELARFAATFGGRP